MMQEPVIDKWNTLPREVVNYIITSYFCTREDHQVIYNYIGTYTILCRKYKGEYDGTYRLYINNTKIAESNYVEGCLDGIHKEWYTTGIPRLYSIYANGKKQGIRMAWYRNNALKSRYNYVNGNINGLGQNWTASGVLIHDEN